MKQLNLTAVTKYVEENIGIFHHKRIERLDRLKLKTVLKKKNPYLFKAMINQFTKEFIQSFCNDNGDINWNKLVEFNSAKKKYKV